ncbi:MAG: hypothetical protein AABZ60_15420 [Planctomycetota bacterium]
MFSVLCLLDLDTIQSGCVYFDVGDGIRSASNLPGEETQNVKEVCWDHEIVDSIFKSYFDHATFLSESEKKILPLAPKIIAFDLGIRFFSDFLQAIPIFVISSRLARIAT